MPLPIFRHANLNLWCKGSMWQEGIAASTITYNTLLSTLEKCWVTQNIPSWFVDVSARCLGSWSEKAAVPSQESKDHLSFVHHSPLFGKWDLSFYVHHWNVSKDLKTIIVSNWCDLFLQIKSIANMNRSQKDKRSNISPPKKVHSGKLTFLNPKMEV